MFLPLTHMPVGTIQVTIHHPQTVDERGSTVPDWALPTQDEVATGCLIAPGASEATLQPRQGTTARWTLYIPPGQPPISATDRVTLPGITPAYRVESPPARWPDPQGQGTYQVVLLADQEG